MWPSGPGREEVSRKPKEYVWVTHPKTGQQRRFEKAKIAGKRNSAWARAYTDGESRQRMERRAFIARSFECTGPNLSRKAQWQSRQSGILATCGQRIDPSPRATQAQCWKCKVWYDRYLTAAGGQRWIRRGSQEHVEAKIEMGGGIAAGPKRPGEIEIEIKEQERDIVTGQFTPGNPHRFQKGNTKGRQFTSESGRKAALARWAKVREEEL